MSGGAQKVQYPSGLDGALTRDEVKALYEILLGRQPENDEIIETKLNQHPSVSSLARSICDCDEFRLRAKREVDPVTRNDVRTLYRILLGRKPESDEIIEKQRSWHNSTISLAWAICASDEARVRSQYRANVALTTADVRALYEVLLRRQPESGELIETQLSLHKSATWLVHSLCESDEAQRRTKGEGGSSLTGDGVRALYRIVLGRLPESDDAIEEELRLHKSAISLAGSLCDLDEFRLRIRREVDGPLTRSDVRALYEILLGWQPESDEIIETHLSRHSSAISLARSLAESDEFRIRTKGGYDLLFNGYPSDELEILRRYLSHSAPEAGFVKDFVGTRMRIGVADFASGFSGRVFDRIPVPGDFRVEAIEWIGVLKAIETSGSHFVTVELGAGWGPWVVSSGHVARHLGKTVRMYAVEADPGKVPNIAQHMADNGFNPKDHVIFGGIAGPSDGFAYFPVINAVSNWSGEAVYDRPPDCDYHTLPSISLQTLMKDEEAVDLIHFDIQGAEFDVVQGSLDALCAKVRWMVIGTHSRSIEGRLIDLLLPANWSLENEQPCRCSYSAGRSHIVVDGTQVWRNRTNEGSAIDG